MPNVLYYCEASDISCSKAIVPDGCEMGMTSHATGAKGGRGSDATVKNDHVDVAALKEKLKGHAAAAKQKDTGKHASEYILDAPKKKSKKEKKEKTSEKQKKSKKSKKADKE